MTKAIRHPLNIFKTASLPFAITMIIAGSATAQTPGLSTEEAPAIQELVVTGQPLDRLMDSEDMARRQANDLDDIFSGVSSVLVGGSVGSGQKIYVRNLGEDTLNIMVDGATQSGVTYHHTGRITIEPELLKQVRVQVGAGDATSGPGALGGAIRFETKDPRDLLGVNDRFGAMLRSGYSTNSEGTKLSGTVYGALSDQISAMASIVTNDQDDMEAANGQKMPGSNSDQELGFLKLVGEFDGGHSLRLSRESLSEAGDKLMRPEWGEGPRNPIRRLEFDRVTTTLSHDWDMPGNDAVQLETAIYTTDFDIYRPFDNYGSAVETWGVNISNTSRLSRHDVTYGVDYREDEVTAGDDAGTESYIEVSDVLGFYLQDNYELSDQLLLSFGGRYDQFEVVDKVGNRFDDKGFSPNIGLSYQLSAPLTLSVGYAESLRGVETNDGFKLFGTTNDPDLEGERAKNLEFGAEYVMGMVTLSAGYHDMVIEDAIGNPVPWSRHYQNLGDLESDGYTLGLTYEGERLSTRLSFLSTDATINDEELTRYAYGYLGTTAGDTLSIDASYQLSSSIDAGWIATLVQGVDDIYVTSADATINKPGYGVHDFYVQWQPANLSAFSATLTVKNAFDKLYLDHGSIEDFTHVPDYEGIQGYPAQGRDVRVSLAYNF